MEENKTCDVCGSTDVDDYGCIDCFMSTATADILDDIDD